MSICRFSSDDFRCDVYCYESEEGFCVAVAGVRRVADEPMPPLPPRWWERAADQMNELCALFRARSAWIDSATRIPLGLEHDGAFFILPDAGSTAQLLETLRAEGYRVPPYAIDILRGEEA